MDTISDQTHAEMKEYWTSLGRFIYYFSQVEQLLQMLLWSVSGADFEVVRAVFSDARYANITDYIKRIRESRGEEEHPLYRKAIDQLGLINRTRNDIVHLSARMTESDGVRTGLVSNLKKAMPGREKQFVVTPTMLDNMSRDLTIAMACLRIVYLERAPLTKDEDAAQWHEIAHRAWQYKPPSQPGAKK